MKLIIIALIVVVVLLGVLFLIRGNEDSWLCVEGEWVEHGHPAQAKPTGGCGDDQTNGVSNFAECAAIGNAVMESYPRQCRDAQGNLFTEVIGNELEKTDLIRLNEPRPNQTVESPLTVSGEARGAWFFEGDFPIILLDADGWIVAQGYASAQGEWMTEDFVPFIGQLEFTLADIQVGNSGSLILQKDNPSGLPANDDALEIPVKFSI